MIGVADEKLGEAPKAFVVRKPGHQVNLWLSTRVSHKNTCFEFRQPFLILLGIWDGVFGPFLFPTDLKAFSMSMPMPLLVLVTDMSYGMEDIQCLSSSQSNFR